MQGKLHDRWYDFFHSSSRNVFPVEPEQIARDVVITA